MSALPSLSTAQKGRPAQAVSPVVQDMLKALSVLTAPDQVTELRIPQAGLAPYYEFFVAPGKLAAEAARFNGKVPGIYFTLNPVNPNVLTRKKAATSDVDIAARRWLPLDFDPIRPAGLSSTDSEHQAALDRAKQVAAWLKDTFGYPEPVFADSGNGAHLLYRIDLPNDEQSNELIKQCLHAIAVKASDHVVSVDKSVHNASRIWKLYGTLAAKGDSTPERPHRVSKILSAPHQVTVLSLAQLKALAATAPQAAQRGGSLDTQGRGRGKSVGYTDTQLVDRLISEIATAIHGNRDNTANKNGFTLGGLCAAGRADASDVRQRIHQAALDSGLSNREAEKFASRSFDQGMSKPLYRLPTWCEGYIDPSLAATDPDTDDSTPPIVFQKGLESAERLLDRPFVLACLEKDEKGDSELLAELFKGRLTYDHSSKAWYTWQGHAWAEDRTQAVKTLVEWVNAQYLHAADSLHQGLIAESSSEGEDMLSPDDDKAVESRAKKNRQYKGLIKRSKELRSLNRVNSVLSFAQTDQAIAVTGDDWDSNPYLLGVRNGVIDLRTGELSPGRPSDYIRTAVPIQWQGLDAPAPRWEQFLIEIFGGDLDLAQFLQRLLGYGLTGSSVEHKLPILWGTGRNGKSLLLEVIGDVLGTVSDTISPDVFMDQGARSAGAASPHLMQLQGRRLVWFSETREGQRLNAAQVKYVTGGDRINARPLFGKPVVFKPTHLAMLITNYKPRAEADDFALWQRILLIPFTQRFVDNPQGPDEHQADHHLRAALTAEKAGILAWMIRGCLQWLAEGLNPPAIVRTATDEYQEAEDTLSEFIEERCIKGDSIRTRANALYRAYKTWIVDEKGQKENSEKTFAERLKRKGFAKERGKHGVSYIGIGVIDESSQLRALDL